MGRVLGARRLSHDTDASTSVERQGETISAWATALGHTVVHLTNDTDVSGATAPFDRDDLGPWLCDPKLAQWDLLAVAKLDRISRSLIDFADLLLWCQKNGKSLVSVAESLDFSTPAGQFIGKLLILFAEWERETMKARRSDASRKLYSRGGYNGGSSLPWGYMTRKDSSVIEVVPDPELVDEITQIAVEVIDGKPVTTAAEERGIDPRTLHKRLHNDALIGVVRYQDEVVRGDDGLPRLREPVLDRDVWDKLQARLDKTSKGQAQRHDADPWRGVIWCATCEHQLFYSREQKRGRGGKAYARYRHEKRQGIDCKLTVPADVRKLVVPYFHRIWSMGGQRVEVIVEHPAEDHSADLARMDETISEWEARAVTGGASADSVLRILDGLAQRRAALVAEGVTVQARTDVVVTDERLADRLMAGSPLEQAALIRSNGYKLLARRGSGGTTHLTHSTRGLRIDAWRSHISELDPRDE